MPPLWQICTCFLFDGLSAKDEQKPKPFSAQHSKSPKLNQKRRLLLRISSLIYWIFFLLLWYNDSCPTEGHTEAAICLKWRLQKFNIRILKPVTCIGFSNIEAFYWSCNFGCFWWICLMLNLYVAHTKIFLWTSGMFLVFISVFLCHKKVVYNSNKLRYQGDSES